MGRSRTDAHGGLVSGGGMKRTDEVMKGVKVKGWQPPAEWGEPFAFPPQTYQGIWVQQLHFAHKTIVRECDPPKMAFGTTLGDDVE